MGFQPPQANVWLRPYECRAISSMVTKSTDRIANV